MNARYLHLATRLFNTPLLLDERKARIIVRVIGPRLGIDAEPIEIDAGRAEAKDRRPYQITDSGIAIIDISGTLVNRVSGLDAMSGLSSYSQIAHEALLAAQDPDVSGILLVVDSFGGEVSGAFTAADALAKAASSKPMWAAVDDNAMSAGYLLASSADKIFVSKTGGVGSVGVVAIHVDQTGADRKAGLKYTIIRSGKYKAEGSPHEALSPSVEAKVQESLDQTRDMFVEHVADGRNMDPTAVYDTEAEIYYGADAVDVGFADDVMNPRDVMEAFDAYLAKGGDSRVSVITSAATAANTERTIMKKQGVVEIPASAAQTTDPPPASPATNEPAAAPAPATNEPAAAPAPAPATNEPAAAAPAAAAPAAAAPAAAAPATAAPAPPAAAVVGTIDFDGVRREAREQGYQQALEIATLCDIGQHPELTYTLLSRHASAGEARRIIREAQAGNPEPLISNRVANAAAPAGGASGTALTKIEAAAKQIQVRDGISYAQAYTKALKDNPALYSEYLKEQEQSRLAGVAR